MATSSRNTTWIILAVAVLAAVAGMLLGRKVSDAPAPVLAHGTAYPAPRPLAQFTLANADGTPFTLDSLRGRWTLLFVGFTHCPDVCPTTLGAFKQVEAGFAKSAPDVPYQLVFVSVDPERDDAKQLRDYVSYFSPRIVATTGTTAELDAITRQLGVMYVKVPLDGGGYTIDHTARIMLVDPEARLVGVFEPPHDAAGIVADVRALAGGR